MECRMPGRVRALLAAALLLAGCEPQRDARTEVVVSAASSLSDVMDELAAEYGRSNPEVTIRNNFGASGTLAQQIRRGAGVDLFVAASAREMDQLEAEGLVSAGTRRVLASNQLVLVVPTANPARIRSFADLASERVRRVAMGAPASVPAGAYARATLRALGVWEAVQPRTVQTTSVRQALTYAERGEVDAAVVYRTDARRSGGVRVVAAAPPTAHPPIAYPAAVVAASQHPEEARRFLRFLAGPAAARVLRRHGFHLPGGADA